MNTMYMLSWFPGACFQKLKILYRFHSCIFIIACVYIDTILFKRCVFQ